MRPRANDLTKQLNKVKEKEVGLINNQLTVSKMDNRGFTEQRLDGIIFKQELIAIALMDKEFNFIQVNEAYARVDQRSVHDFPGRNHFDLYPDEEVKEIFTEVVRSKKPYQAFARPFVYPHNPERGVTYWDFMLVPILASNEVKYMLLALNDVTKHHIKQVEYERFFKLSMDLFCVLEINTGYFKEANPTFEATLGYTKQELFSKPFLDFVHPDDQRKTAEKLDQLAKGTPINFYKNRLICSDGSSKTLRWNASSIPEEGLVYAVGRDITKLRENEAEMARLEKLNLIGEMAAGLGHEIKNPLTTVRGFLQVLGNKKELNLYKDYINLMIDELDRSNSLITQYLCLAKNAPTEKKNQNLNTIIELLSPLIQAHAVEHDIHVEFKLDTIPELLLDGKEMRQLILNLVNNGIEAMPYGGNLKISTCKEGNYVLLKVQDSGQGIAPEIIDKIGTPFLTTKENGTGLGLSICFSIANRHNARITVDTGPGGSTIFIRFKTGD